MSIAKHLRIDPTPAAQAATSAAGLPSPPAWAGYWTFVSATLILAFVLYLAKHGRLAAWLAFFTPQTPAPIASATGAGSTPQVQGLFGGATAPAAGGLAAQILNPSTDPVAGPLSKALTGLKTMLPGFGVGLGN
jgi:hypothetical protein